MWIALCIYFSVHRGQYDKEAEAFHHCIITQPRANIFSRYSMGAKHKEGVWEMLTIMATYIPFSRIKDFIASQTCADGFAIDWIVAARIHEVQVGRPQIDFYIEHVYECAFGPIDHT